MSAEEWPKSARRFARFGRAEYLPLLVPIIFSSAPYTFHQELILTAVVGFLALRSMLEGGAFNMHHW